MLVRICKELRMKRIACVVVAAVGLAAAGESFGANPDLLRFDGEALVKMRERYKTSDPAVTKVMEELKASADKATTMGPWSVTYKKVRLKGVDDPHEYVTIAPYYWPDPSKPDG